MLDLQLNIYRLKCWRRLLLCKADNEETSLITLIENRIILKISNTFWFHFSVFIYVNLNIHKIQF